MSPLLAFGLGWLVCRYLGSGGGGSSSIFTLPAGAKPPGAPPGAGPVLTSTAVSWPSQPPSGLPAFPSGWKPAQTTPAVVQRAWQLMSVLKMGQVKYEQGTGGAWLAFKKVRQADGRTGVNAFTPKQQGAPVVTT